MDEYPDKGPSDLTFTIDGELADRLRAYARLNDLTLSEALGEMLDFPLSGYSESELPKTPEAVDALKKMLATYGKRRVRTKAIASKIQVHQSATRRAERVNKVILVGNIGRDPLPQTSAPGEDPGTKHRPPPKRRMKLLPKK